MCLGGRRRKLQFLCLWTKRAGWNSRKGLFCLPSQFSRDRGCLPGVAIGRNQSGAEPFPQSAFRRAVEIGLLVRSNRPYDRIPSKDDTPRSCCGLVFRKDSGFG